LPLRHGNFRRRYWLPALTRCGLTTIHFHDLRHAGNTLTAGTGATLRELMDRMGHSSTRAALIYLHGSDTRQRRIAATPGKLAGKELTGRRRSPRKALHGEALGTQRVRRGSRAS
jgi:integrase